MGSVKSAELGQEIVMKIFGVEFSPLSIPTQRRWETFAVFFWMATFMFSTIFMGPVFIMIYILFYSNYWYLGILYLCWVILDLKTCNRGGRKGWIPKFVRNWNLWKHFSNFFPIKIIKTAELNRNKNYLVGSHPHGVLSAGAYSCFATEGTNFSQVFPGMIPHILTLQEMFFIPLFRELWYATQACAATKAGMEYLLTQPGGQVVVLVPGGAQESLNCDKGEVRLILRQRKGFIKLALRCGSDLVPCFTFGENGIYDKLPNPEGSFVRRFQDKIQSIFGFAPVVFLGRGIFNYNLGFVPHRRPLTLVLGTPISVKQNKNPSQEEIDELHKTYMDSLVRLYEEYNPIYGDPNVELILT